MRKVKAVAVAMAAGFVLSIVPAGQASAYCWDVAGECINLCPRKFNCPQ